jgi:hypothetical protein
MCLSISRLSRKPASNGLNEGQVVEYEEVPNKEKHQQDISSFNADLAESNR